jgi:hypothetical protein
VCNLRANKPAKAERTYVIRSVVTCHDFKLTEIEGAEDETGIP